MRYLCSRKETWLFAMLLIIGISGIGTAEEQVVINFNDSFESYSVGTYPTSWINIFSGSSGLVTSDGKDGGNGFTISAQPGYGRADGILVPKANFWEIQYDIMIKTPSINAWGSTAGDLFEKTDSSNGIPSAGVGFTNDGKIYIVHRGGSYPNIYLKDYITNQWYNIKIHYNFEDLEMSIMINDSLFANNISISSPPNYQYASFSANWGWTIAYDNVNIIGKEIVGNSIGYSALVATGQNTFMQSSNGNFGLILKGETKTLNNSVILNNTGDISAKVEARFNDSISGVFGLISGANLLNATNFALGQSGSLVSLDNTGVDVQIATAPSGVTALDARLDVPSEQVAGDYSGTVVLTFSNDV